MPMQLRKRLSCYYCGKRCNSKLATKQKFQCEHCLAVNFLDENGEIADVPPYEQGSVEQYARPIEVIDTNLFCSTCLKNQYIYTSALAEYLPDQNDPLYHRCEVALPAFKAQLEERYPQCCAQCEPRVRAQLQQANYNARSDHMRRMLDRSRARRVASRWGWRSLLISTAGFGHISSMAIQLAWHVLGSQAVGTSELFHWSSCSWKPTKECTQLVAQYVPFALVLALLCVWWNPRWKHKLDGREGRLIGLRQYYNLQCGLLFLRFTVWIMLDGTPQTKLTTMAHSVSCVVLMLLAGLSYMTIKVDNTPLVNWHQEVGPLVSQAQFVPPVEPQIHQPSIESFSSSLRHETESWHPPTPPEAEDAMDWTPSQAFTPQLKQQRRKEPTPFYGTLPALSRPRLGAISEPERTAIGIPPGHFDDRRRLPQHRSSTASALIAEPKFFPNLNSDTGLENIFGQVFSLKDHSADTLLDQNENVLETAQSTRPEVSFLPSLAAFRCLFLIGVMILWTISGNALPALDAYKPYLMTLVAFVPLSMAIDATSKLESLAFNVECGVFAVLTFQRFYVLSANLLWDKVGTIAIALLVVQATFMIGRDNALSGIQEFDHASALPSLPQSTLAPMSSSADESSLILRKNSSNSTESNDSIGTTSTAPGWKTPKLESRRFNANKSTSNATPSGTLGMGSLFLDRDEQYGSHVTPRRSIRQRK